MLVLLDTNAYLRLAKRVRPVIGIKFGQKGYVLTIHRFVEDEVAFPVERFQVGLYARSLVRLFLLVTPDVERNLMFLACSVVGLAVSDGFRS